MTLDPLRNTVTTCRVGMREASSARCLRQAKKGYKRARKLYRTAVKEARQNYLEYLLGRVNPFNTSEIFKMATRLQQGIGLQRKPRVRTDTLKVTCGPLWKASLT